MAGSHRVSRPVLRVGCGKEVGDVVGVGIPPGTRLTEGGRVTGLGRLQQFHGDAGAHGRQRTDTGVAVDAWPWPASTQ